MRMLLWPARKFSSLHIEEIIGVLFFIPSLLITLKANLYFYQAGRHIPPRFYGGLTRLAVTLLLMLIYFWLIKNKSAWKGLFWLRAFMPFVFCIAIYTNMHDTIGFVNSNDVHGTLVKIDQWMFGVQPCVWAQQFYQPWLTDYLSISYMNYFMISVAVVAYLLVKKRYPAMRTVLVGTILAFYLGYFLYVIFPAAPPRIVLASQFVRDFSGSWITTAQQQLANINPSSSRGAFPSLHCAVTLISLLYAWKFSKGLFWVLLIPGVSLVVATIYLRHHYVIDIIAGFALAVFVYFAAPKLDAWWERTRLRIAGEENKAPAASS